jgi:hypothetical protein
VISGLRVTSSNSIGPVEQYFSYVEFQNARDLSKTTGDITSVGIHPNCTQTHCGHYEQLHQNHTVFKLRWATYRMSIAVH